MNKKTAYFNSTLQGTSEHTAAIVPLISEDKKLGKLFFIGTAFYISNSGILMTAKHNLFDKENKLFSNLGVYHFLPDNQCILRPIRTLTFTNEYDIAYLLPEQILNKNKELVSNPTLILSNSEPVIGEQLATYGYPNSRMNVNEFHFNADFFLGNCIQYKSEGSPMLRNPCYQTSIHIKSGSSGGPVFDKEGHVFAICSTGYDLIEGEDNISFITPIQPSFNLILEDGLGNRSTILELIENGIILLHKVPAANTLQ